MGRGPWLLVLALGALWAGTSSASTVLDLSVAELAERSEQVLVGRVAAQHSRLDRADGGQRVLTETTFEVDRVLKGDKVRHLSITQVGGTAGEGVDRITQVVHGQAAFAAGERVVVFLERAGDRLVVTGLAQGKYTLKPGPRGLTAERDVHGPRAVKREGHRVATLAGAPRADRMLLSQLEAIVRGERPVASPVEIVKTPQVRVRPAEGTR